jgi:hypothetical protein
MDASGNGEVVVTFTKQEALVLFEWLAQSNQGAAVAQGPAEQRVLSGLEACFEKTLVEPFQSNYLDILQAARQAICNDAAHDD